MGSMMIANQLCSSVALAAQMRGMKSHRDSAASEKSEMFCAKLKLRQERKRPRKKEKE